MENHSTTNRDDVVAIELPAPEGWKKKFTPKKDGTGGTPRRNEIVFISPTDEEIKSKRQLDQYLKSHPGGPSASEFDWGTGDTPRRSARLSEKSKPVETPESDSSKKRQKKSTSKKEAEEKDDAEGETTEEKEAAAEETKESAEIAMEDAEDVGDHNEGELVDENTVADKDNVKDTEQKSNEREVDTKKALENKETVQCAKHSPEDNIDETNMEKPENQYAGNETSIARESDSENKSLLTPGFEGSNEEAENELAEPEALPQLPIPNEAASSEKVETVKDAIPEAGAKGEINMQVAEVGKEDNPNEETPAEKVVNALEAKPDNDSLEKDEVGKSMENQSVSCEEAPHEPKASQVSC